MPAAAAALHDLGDLVGLFDGLGNRLAIGRSRRGSHASDQAYSRRHDYREHKVTHSDSSRLMLHHA
jgi:hypothetical protein